MYSIGGICLSGSGWAASAEHLNEYRGALYRDSLSMGRKQSIIILLFESAWRLCHLAGSHNLPSMSLLGVWDMANGKVNSNCFHNSSCFGNREIIAVSIAMNVTARRQQHMPSRWLNLLF